MKFFYEAVLALHSEWKQLVMWRALLPGAARRRSCCGGRRAADCLAAALHRLHPVLQKLVELWEGQVLCIKESSTKNHEMACWQPNAPSLDTPSLIEGWSSSLENKTDDCVKQSRARRCTWSVPSLPCLPPTTRRCHSVGHCLLVAPARRQPKRDASEKHEGEKTLFTKTVTSPPLCNVTSATNCIIYKCPTYPWSFSSLRWFTNQNTN